MQSRTVAMSAGKSNGFRMRKTEGDAQHRASPCHHVAQQPFGHLTAGGVVRTEEENAFLHLLIDSFPIHWKSNVAASAPRSCATMKPGIPAGAIPENVSVRPRAIVTAGFAKLVLDVNQ
jgi:hypothetical protein